jgi:hypothetical protein
MNSTRGGKGWRLLKQSRTERNSCAQQPSAAAANLRLRSTPSPHHCSMERVRTPPCYAGRRATRRILLRCIVRQHWKPTVRGSRVRLLSKTPRRLAVTARANVALVAFSTERLTSTRFRAFDATQLVPCGSIRHHRSVQLLNTLIHIEYLIGHRLQKRCRRPRAATRWRTPSPARQHRPLPQQPAAVLPQQAPARSPGSRALAISSSKSRSWRNTDRSS